jgi:hypothetical protein
VKERKKESKQKYHQLIVDTKHLERLRKKESAFFLMLQSLEKHLFIPANNFRAN